MYRNELIKAYGPDYKEMTKHLLSCADLDAEIHAKAPGTGKRARIAIKPNLVCPVPAELGATTHPEIVAGIIEYLKEHGYEDITVMEGSWVGDSTEDAFNYCGFYALAEKYGIRLIDTKKVPGISHAVHGAVSGKESHAMNESTQAEMSERRSSSACAENAKAGASGDLSVSVCRCVNDIDYLINVPVLKGHCQTKMTCALKNMKGLIPDSEKRRFHKLGLHDPIAMLNTVLKPDLIVTDHICGDPDFEEGGSPLIRNCIMVSKDPVLTDAYGCTLLGIDPSDVPYIKKAAMLGVGCDDVKTLRVTTVSGRENEELPFTRDLLKVSYAVNEIDSCSACYASLTGALLRLKNEGKLEQLNKKICIGQGYKEGKYDASSLSGCIGIGSCTSCLPEHLHGCPPDENKIYEYLVQKI